MNDTPLRRCTGCGEQKPATTKFFHQRNRRGSRSLQAACKICRSESRRRPKQNNAPCAHPITCKHCGETKAAENFRVYSPSANGRRSKCQDCCQKALAPCLAGAPEGSKRCSTCREVKAMTTEFWHKGSGYGGFDSMCLECCRREYANMTEEERIRVQKQAALRYTADPTKARRRVREWAADFKARDPEGYAEYCLERARRHINKDPEGHRLKARVSAQKRRARINNNSTSFFTTADVERLLIEQEYRCAYCDIELEAYHVDHIIPITKGGGSEVENIAISCPCCNQSKGNKLLTEWMARPTQADSQRYYDRLRITPRKKAGKKSRIDYLPRSNGWNPRGD